MNYVDLLGYAAGVLVVISLLPQVMKSWKTKSTRDISFTHYAAYAAGLVLWIFYALIINNGPLWVMSFVELILASSVLYLKVKHG